MKRILLLSLLAITALQAQEQEPKKSTATWTDIAKDFGYLTGVGLAKTAFAAVNPGYYFVGAATKFLKNAGLDLRPKNNGESTVEDMMKFGTLAFMHGVLGTYTNQKLSALNFCIHQVTKVNNSAVVNIVDQARVGNGEIHGFYVPLSETYTQNYMKLYGRLIPVPKEWPILISGATTGVDIYNMGNRIDKKIKQ